jgi:hypothetical protein
MHLVFVQDATNASIPEYVDVMSEIKITPGCTYEIVVEANPNDGKRKASLNYTVPGKVNIRNNRLWSNKNAYLNLGTKLFRTTKSERPQERKPVT